MSEKPTYEDLERKVASLQAESADLKRMIDRLVDNESKYRTFFENSLDALFISKPDGKILEANAAACTMFGYTEQELIREGRNAIVDTEDRRFLSALAERERNGRFAGELTFKRKDGTKMPAEISTVVFKTGTGEERASIIVRDISEHKRAEKALRESEAFIRTVMDHLPIGLAVNSVEPGVDFLYMNDNFPKCYRTTREELVHPDAFWDVVYEDPVFREEIRKRVLEDCDGNDPARMHWEDVPIARKGEETVYVNARNTPVPEKSLMISTVWDVTDRKRMEVELKKSEEKYRNLFESIDQGFCVIEVLFDAEESPVDYRLLEVNPAFEKQTGLRDAEGKLMRSLVPDHEPHWFETYGRIATTGESERFAREAKALNRWYDVYAFRIDEPGSRKVAILFNDITERKQAEDALRESEARYRTIFDHGFDGIVIIDPEAATPIIFNNQACAQLGYTREEFGRLKIADIDLMEGPEEVSARIRKVTGTGYDEFETLHRTKHGEQRNVLVQAQYIHDGGKPIYHCIWRDITESKRSEETARRETSLRNILLDNLPCTALVLKKQTREIVACNEIARNRGAVVGRVCHDILLGSGTPCSFCQAAEVWETGVSREVEVEYMGRFWHGIWVPFSDDLYVHYIFDITDRKRAEAEEEKLQKQLLSAQRMEAVGTLAGGIAHDFNNALMGIMGFAEVLKESLAGDEQAQSDLNEIMRCADRASTLTRQLLTYARRQIIEPANLNLNRVITDLMRFVSKILGEQIEIRTYLAEDLPAISADIGQIEQVVMNLVLNARDAMLGGGRLTIETGQVHIDADYRHHHSYMEMGSYVLLTISDTGIGMDKSIEERVFEPFFTTKSPEQGSGLGLSIVYGIVKQHKGFIHLYSELGKGTTFKIHLPAVAGNADAILPSRPSEIRGGTETILLAEDDGSVRSLIERTLTQLGYTVLVARDGEEAVEAFRRNADKVDLALLDVVMPRKGGKEVYGEMRKSKEGLKAIFMSGYTADAVHESYVLNPGVSFLSKPFSPGAMVRKIREALDLPCR